MSKRKIHRWGSGKVLCDQFSPDDLHITTFDNNTTCKKCIKQIMSDPFRGLAYTRFWNKDYYPDYSFIYKKDTAPTGRDNGVRLLDNWLAAYLDLTEETEPPQSFHLWTAITLIGAMLGRKCEVRLGPETFFPNLYTILIGPPGVRKGTAIKYGTDILKEIEDVRRAPDAVTKEQLIAEFELVADSINMNGNLFNHSSLLVVAPELVVFIKENDHERLGYLCQLYDGLDRFEYKTKTSTNQYIVNPGLWILGATTPNWIEIAMKQLGVGGGMTSRTIFVFAAKKGKHISATELPPFNPSLKSKLINDLGAIKQMAGQFSFSGEAEQVYNNWYYGEYKETGIDDTRFASYWERLPSMVIKVSMVVSASRRDDMLIRPSDVVQSIRMFREIHPEMPQAFGAMGKNIMGSQTEMVRCILREKKRAYRHEILRTLHMHISERDYWSIKNTLLAERFCRRETCQEMGDEVLIMIEPTTSEPFVPTSGT